jgi:hypothetical protein
VDRPGHRARRARLPQTRFRGAAPRPGPFYASQADGRGKSHYMSEGLYDGPFAVTCSGPSCERSALQEPGTPGPTDWLDLSIWRGRSADGIGYFCSLECLSDAMSELTDTYGADWPRAG